MVILKGIIERITIIMLLVKIFISIKANLWMVLAINEFHGGQGSLWNYYVWFITKYREDLRVKSSKEVKDMASFEKTKIITCVSYVKGDIMNCKKNNKKLRIFFAFP